MSSLIEFLLYISTVKCHYSLSMFRVFFRFQEDTSHRSPLFERVLDMNDDADQVCVPLLDSRYISTEIRHYSPLKPKYLS